ncbi:hypothetical protein GGR53DRAFT_468324 [Hypoxylon sp. FL1150]|nr:hypothetical protein GGR53DRAFT_468324 [Hypoxylon sp. FL1150]
MPTFDETATSEQIIEAFAPQIKGKPFVITGTGKPSIGSWIATSLTKGSQAHILIASWTASKVEVVLNIGHFLLTNLLVPALLAGGGARVVNLTSSGYLILSFRFDDWNFSDDRTYDHLTGYGQAKTANVLLAYGLNQQLKNRGVTSTAAITTTRSWRAT